MRVECEACRILAVASVTIAGDVVCVTCPVCRHVMRVRQGLAEGLVEGLAEASSHAPRCPKCGAPYRGEATACPACGLAASRMAAYAETRDAAVPEAVQAAWSRTVLDWNDAARHDQLLQLVATNNSYAWAAGRYRTRGRDAVAQRQLDRLRRAAEAALLAGATPRPDATVKSSRVRRRVLAVLITTITAGALYAMGIADQPLPWRTRSIPARLLPPGHPAGPSTGK